MASAFVSFDAPDLAARVEYLRPTERDALPFGVIELDREGQILIYSATEARLSGYGEEPLGKNFFAVGESPNCGELRQRIMQAIERGPVDMEFGWIGGRGASRRELRLRVLSSRRGGVWIFVERDDGQPRHRQGQHAA